MTHGVRTGPGQSFSVPFSPHPSLASPSSTSATALDSPHSYPPPHNRRASYEPSAHGTPYNPTWDIEHDDKRSALVESLNRSATVVFWYQSNTQPLRLRQEIPTFPFFSFNSLTEVVEQLRFSDRTYLDTYNPRTGTWEQQQIFAVRRIESEQRLLYRIRRGLFEGLRDEECPGLESEIRLQEEDKIARVDGPGSKSSRKRGPDVPLSPPVNKHHRSFSVQSSSSYTAASPLSTGAPSSPLVIQGRSPAGGINLSLPSSAHSTYPSPSSTQQTNIAQGSTPAPSQPNALAFGVSPQIVPGETVEVLSQEPDPGTISVSVQRPSAPPETPPDSQRTPDSHPAAAAIPLPHPSLLLLPGSGPVSISRKWPNDFFVYEIAAGLRAMEELAAAEPALKQDEIFRRAFGGLPYVKSTFCRHRALWRQAPPTTQREFVEMGRDLRAAWSEFARRVEGRDDRGRRSRARARTSGAPEGAEEVAAQAREAQERMMNVLGMPLQSIMASIPQVHAMQGGGMANMGMDLGTQFSLGANVPRPTSGGAPVPENEEPVMGSLLPPDEGRQMQQRCT